MKNINYIGENFHQKVLKEASMKRNDRSKLPVIGKRKKNLSEMAGWNASKNNGTYPSSFNFSEFSALSSYKKRVDYCEARLTRLASGSSRIVYEVGPDTVLKLAKNRKGVAQNQMEIELGTSDYFYCFAPVYNYDEDAEWLEMKRASKAKKSDFKRIYGIPFEAVCCAMEDYKTGYTNPGYCFNRYSRYQGIVDKLYEEEEGPAYEFIESIVDYLGNYTLETIGDLERLSSWGIINDNGEEEAVLIDYGLSDDIYNSYYKR